MVVQSFLEAHADGHLIETDGPGADPHAFLQKRILVLAGYDDQRVVHRCLQDVDQWDPAVNDFQSLAELQRSGLAFIIADAAQGSLREGRVNDFDIESGFPVEALFIGYIVTRELRLGCPLGCKNEFLGLCRPCACQQ